MSETPPSRRSTMEAVAKAAGVSLSTVDRVMNLRANVRADTARRIADAAAQLGFYGRNVIEQRLLQQRPSVRLGFLLQKRGVAFYQGLAKALADAAALSNKAQVRVMIHYIDELDPAATAQRIRQLQGEVDALGVVSADHAVVRQALAELQGAGTPVLALVSDLEASARAGYVGVDNRRMGRSAGWFVQHLSPAPGTVAVMLGSQRFQCQELCEMSFRSYLAEQSPDWELLATRLTLEDKEFAYAGTLDLLSSEPDLAGLYVAGGGIEGVLAALGELRQQGTRLPTVVCHDLTALTRAALHDGVVQAVLSHPVASMAQGAVDSLIEAVLAPSNQVLGKSMLAPQVDILESI